MGNNYIYKVYYANWCGNATNCYYPNIGESDSAEELKKFFSKDHTFIQFKNDYRGVTHFVSADIATFDCDNDESDDDKAWISPEDIESLFYDVPCVIYTSRNHMKQKGNKSPRPRFHIAFPVHTFVSAKEYAEFMKRVQQSFPFFDDKALDAGRFFYGNPDTEVTVIKGNTLLNDFLTEEQKDTFTNTGELIREGSRNTTMSKFAGRVLKRYGDTDEAYSRFISESQKCEPPLEEDELKAIWRSAQKFYKKISSQPGYIPPEQYGSMASSLYKPINISCESTIDLSELCPENNDRYRWTDSGNGKLFADVFKDKARYVPERKKWFCFDGSRWCEDVESLKTMELCKELANALLKHAITITDEHKRTEFLKHCNKWQVRRNRETILKDARSIYPLNMHEFDNNPYLFNCANGTLNLETMEFCEHNASDFLTKISPVIYDPIATNERFDSFITEVMSNDNEKALFLQKALGYSLTGDTKYECMFFLYGATTRNGKGTLMESILGVMGDYGKSVRPETIAAKQNNSSQNPTEDIARLSGLRFANISEPSRGITLNAAQVKSMTGNDTINARYLHENSFDFKPQFKLYVNTNYLPVITDMTLFSSNRIFIIPFDRHFEPWEQDNSLKTEFAKAEVQSSILNWLIQGYVALCKEGLNPPKAVTDATKQYCHDSDKVQQFFDDCLEEQYDGEIRTSDVYDDYRSWCSKNGYYPESTRGFYQSLRTKATVKRKRPLSGGEKASLLIGYKRKDTFLC